MHQKESVSVTQKPALTNEKISALQIYKDCESQQRTDERVEILVTELIGRVADKWTVLILDVLTERRELRVTRLSEIVSRIIYKMLTQTLRVMEREGPFVRTVHPVVPQKVEYKRTGLVLSLGAALCGV